jgi:ribonuclease HI
LITFHWVNGHAGLKGKERTGYLAKIFASYVTAIAYDVIPTIRGKQTLEDYYTKF